MRAAADAAHEAVQSGELLRRFNGVIISHCNHFVDHIDIQYVGDKTSADALNRMLARPQRQTVSVLRYHGTDGWLDGDNLRIRLALFENLAYSGDRSAGADARHKDIDLPIGVARNLLGRGFAMNLGICRILELLRHEESLVAQSEVFRSPHGPGHAFGRGSQHKFSPDSP